MVHRILSSILDIVYPPQCFLCSVSLQHGNALCERCGDSLERIESPFCECCGEPFEGVISEGFDCPNCKGLPMRFDFAIAALCCTAEAKTMVHELKYKKQVYLASVMARLMAERYREDERFRGEDWVVVPVPLHWRRRMKRGFNQAEELAYHFCKILDLTMQDLLKRGRKTGTQTALDRKKRIQNLKGSFSRKGSQFEGGAKNIILLDDVLTTGSTAHECALVLKEDVNIEQVAVITFMRG